MQLNSFFFFVILSVDTATRYKTVALFVLNTRALNFATSSLTRLAASFEGNCLIR